MRYTPFVRGVSLTVCPCPAHHFIDTMVTPQWLRVAHTGPTAGNSSRSPVALPGSHSVWASVTLCEHGCRPLHAVDVVVVFTEDQLVLRITRTAFTFAIAYPSILRLVQRTDESLVEIYVETAVGTARVYHLALGEPDKVSALTHLLLSRISHRARLCSDSRKHAGDAEPLWAVVPGECSLLPLDVLQASGWTEGNITAETSTTLPFPFYWLPSTTRPDLPPVTPNTTQPSAHTPAVIPNADLPVNVFHAREPLGWRNPPNRPAIASKAGHSAAAEEGVAATSSWSQERLYLMSMTQQHVPVYYNRTCWV